MPEGANLGRALNHAMEDIERANPDLADALPKNCGAVGDDILRELIKTLAPVEIPGKIDVSRATALQREAAE